MFTENAILAQRLVHSSQGVVVTTQTTGSTKRSHKGNTSGEVKLKELKYLPKCYYVMVPLVQKELKRQGRKVKSIEKLWCNSKGMREI